MDCCRCGSFVAELWELWELSMSEGKGGRKRQEREGESKERVSEAGQSEMKNHVFPKMGQTNRQTNHCHEGTGSTTNESAEREV